MALLIMKLWAMVRPPRRRFDTFLFVNARSGAHVRLLDYQYSKRVYIGAYMRTRSCLESVNNKADEGKDSLTCPVNKDA